MAKQAKQVATEFRRNEKVKALEDLPGVPQATEGRVLLVSGFAWTRYHVAFDNGVDIGTVDGSKLSRPKQYEAALARRADAAVATEEEVSANGDTEEVAAASAGDAKVVNGVDVPAHLLERSQRARERLGAAA